MMSFLEEAFRIDRRFFEKNQRFLLKLANTRLGRVFYGIKDHPFSRKFVRILPNAVEWDAGNGKRTIQFIPCNYYADQVRRVMKTVGAFSLGTALQLIEGRAFALLPMLAGTTTTFNTSTGFISGYNRRDNAGAEVWATLRTGAGTGTNIGTMDVRWNSASGSNWQLLDRSHCFFDTSALAGATGVSATFEVYFNSPITSPSDSTNKRDLHLAASTVVDPSTLANTDYTLASTTSFGSIAFGSLSTLAYNLITLNGSGVSAINLTGATKFSLQSGADITNTAPAHNGTNNDVLAFRIQGSTDSNKPKLNVTYTPAPVTTTITKSLQYCIKTTPSTITKSLQYVVTSTVTNTLTKSLQYCIKASPTITKSLQYCVKRTPATITKAVKYAINVPVTITKSLQYVINFIPEAIGSIRGISRRTGLGDGTTASVGEGSSETTNIGQGTSNDPPQGKKGASGIGTGAKL